MQSLRVRSRMWCANACNVALKACCASISVVSLVVPCGLKGIADSPGIDHEQHGTSDVVFRHANAGFAIEYPDLPGCISYGDTPEEEAGRRQPQHAGDGNDRRGAWQTAGVVGTPGLRQGGTNRERLSEYDRAQLALRQSDEFLSTMDVSQPLMSRLSSTTMPASGNLKRFKYRHPASSTAMTMRPSRLRRWVPATGGRPIIKYWPSKAQVRRCVVPGDRVPAPSSICRSARGKTALTAECPDRLAALALLRDQPDPPGLQLGVSPAHTATLS